MAFSVVVEGSIYLSILMEWGERDVLFHKTIFIFGPCGAKNKNLSQLRWLRAWWARKNFLQAKNFLSSLTLAQLSMQASKVVAAVAAWFLKGNATWFLLWDYYWGVYFFFIRSMGRRCTVSAKGRPDGRVRRRTPALTTTGGRGETCGVRAAGHTLCPAARPAPAPVRALTAPQAPSNRGRGRHRRPPLRRAWNGSSKEPFHYESNQSSAQTLLRAHRREVDKGFNFLNQSRLWFKKFRGLYIAF